MLKEWEGKLPEETNEEYHKRKELSSSDIKHRLETAMHFKRMVIEKDQVKREPKASFDLGSCAHECYLLNDYSQFAALPEGIDRRTKEGKEAYNKFLLKSNGKRIITQDQLTALNGMMKVISKNEKAQDFLKGSKVEAGYLYEDEETGLPCKFRPDILNLDRGFIADYKSAQSASPYSFSKAVARFMYHLSAAHYLKGAQRLWPGLIKNYYFVAQESSEPYAVAIYEMDASDILRSYELRSNIMRLIKGDYERNEWPDWSERVIKLSVPGYAFSLSDVG